MDSIIHNRVHLRRNTIDVILSGTTGDSSNDPIAEFCLYLERQGRSAITVMNYRSDLKGMVRWSEGRNKEKFDPLRFAQADVDEYRAFLIRRYKASTVNRRLATWKLYSKWALHTGLLESPVLTHVVNMRLTPRVRSAPQYLDPSDQAELLRVVRAQGSVEDIAVITLLLNTGIRVSELCALRWTDVEISDGKGQLTVYASKKRVNRSVPLNDAARKAFISLGYPSHIGTTGHIFTEQSGSMTRRRVAGLFNRYCKLAGLTGRVDGGPLTPSVLRVTFLRHLLNAGVNPHIVGMWIDNSTLKSMDMYYRTFEQDIEQDVALKTLEALSG